PSIAASEEVSEGAVATFNCSSPYACPFGGAGLRWGGYDARRSAVATVLRLDPAGTLLQQRLTSTFSWRDHGKRLLCELSLGPRSATAELVLRVRHAPQGVVASVQPSARNTRVGDAVSFACAVNSSYPPVTAYRWYKDGAAVGSEPVLTLRHIQREDYGQYHCEAENAVGSGAAPALTLFVFSAEVSVRPAAEVREGTVTTLSCDVPGGESQELNYTWYKNGAWLQEGPAHTLLFRDVAAADAGYYSCKVQNDLGSVASPAVSLSVNYAPRAPSIALFQEAPGGRLAIVHCTVDSHPPAALSLYRDGALVASSGSHEAPGRRLRVVTARNSLRLEMLALAPADGGEYRCAAHNALGNATAAKFFAAHTARVLIQPAAEVREGDAVTLTCKAARPAAPYAWYRNGRQLPQSSAAVLLFPSVRAADASTYRCETHGGDTSAAVSLRVLYAPREPRVTVLLEAQRGRLAVFQCAVESNPAARLDLYRGDELVASSAPGRSHSARVSVAAAPNALRAELRDVTPEDEGSYRLEATNAHGTASQRLYFRV
ncbi:SN protein, partial [Crypturellus undulatus]|nr:SN protein [Crypturellus undulatus]